MTSARRVVLSTFGSRGDLHPFLAIAQELRCRGYSPIVAAAPRYAELVRNAGIDFHRCGPDPQDYEMVLNLSGAEIYRRLCTQPKFTIDGLLNPFLRRWYDDTYPLLVDAAYFIAHPLALGGRLAAEKLAIPSMRVALSPYAFLSEYDPPILFERQRLSRAARWLGARAQSLFVRRLRSATEHLAEPFHRMKASLGLAPSKANPLFDVVHEDEVSVAAYSPALTSSHIIVPGGPIFAGFTRFEGIGSELSVSADLESYLSESSRPIVFTLGTAGLYDVDRFVKAIAHAATVLRFRALVVLGDAGREKFQHLNSNRFLVSSYAPYSAIFPRARIVVHPAGIGTCAQALRAGIPQLLLPTVVDQPDTADRVRRMGVGSVLPMQKLTGATLIKHLKILLSDESIRSRAIAVGRQLGSEPDGAKAIADCIDSRLGLTGL
jgi:rhamnosyltransferase subunit B